LKIWMVFLVAAGGATAKASLSAGDLRCEYLADPLGIDVLQPRLSWVLEANQSVRGQYQTAWQVLVSSSSAQLAHDYGDLWDSGKVAGDQSIQVAYHGVDLQSRQECYWKVRVWDKDGKVSHWSAPATWSMGLLRSADWHGQWIGLDENRAATLVEGTYWIWFPEGHPEKGAPVGTRFFRLAFDLPAEKKIKSARWLIAADNQFVAFANGKQIGMGSSYKGAKPLDLVPVLHSGRNVLAVRATNTGSEANPAGLLSRIEIQFESGEPLVLITDDTWSASAEEFAGWNTAAFEDSTWLPAMKLGLAGMEPWGEVAGPEDCRLPARWLRKEFEVEPKLVRATAYYSGQGASELYLDGIKVSDDVLSPALSDYSKRVYYVTRDLTSQLRAGRHALGVVLGNGRFFAPRGRVPTGTQSYGAPKLLFELRLDYADGSCAVVVSDRSWKLTADGPIRANNEYDGEEFDARMDLGPWSRPGYDDHAWTSAQVLEAPAGALASQKIPPIRVTETMEPISVKLVQSSSTNGPATYIYDFGQNLVGWCRLRISGPAGPQVALRHAETLKPDGTLYVDNLRSARATDTYILDGRSNQIYEPRFTYHGFRFVELSGYPGKPGLHALQGRVVHDDLDRAGQFECSNPLLNRIYQNVMWGVRGNYRSIPTDCPQRDERQGWLGDRSAESRGETYLFNTAALYAKWLQDMADAQKPAGSVPDVCPPYWPIYSDNVTWPSSSIIIPGTLYDQFGDRTVVQNHYESARLWMQYMRRFVTNGIISKDSYGDWCVPPEDPQLIHSKDPARKTDPALIATAYFYKDALLMRRYALLLCRNADAQMFGDWAVELNSAFNSKFYRQDLGQYDNGTQTSCVLPLAFGLVPESERRRVFDHLVEKITHDCNNHIGTGLIGGQWLMQVLTENGRPDLAYILASQKTYPSWGYMVEKGATTIWELWNGDTADPAMNSGNHVMLVGDLITWLYEDLAGIKPDPEHPAFKHLIMRPEPTGDLSYVKASHNSAFGAVLSDWRRRENTFTWNVTVPVNCSATLWIPASAPEAVLESGRPISRAAGLHYLRVEKGRVLIVAGSGRYHFESRMD
jgi:alpha-L-rhamnosidase